MNLKLQTPEQILNQTIDLPGSKSISNRILIIKALSKLPFTISNISDSDDTRHLKEALDSYLTLPVINVGHAGTDMRFLTAFLSIKEGEFELTGSERLQQRPVKDLVTVLQTLGANITYKNVDGYPPLKIKGKQIDGGKVEISGSVSSQFITALLLVAPYFKNGIELTIKNELVSTPYVHMTVELMKEFGASVIWEDNKITVHPSPYQYSKSDFLVESDWSSASYYFGIVALSKLKTTLVINGLFKNSLQADSACVPIYKEFGVEVEFIGNTIQITKTLNVDNSKCFEYDFVYCPDIAQTVACTCLGLKRPFYFKGLQTLKVKETDRIIALKNEIKKFGYIVEVSNDSMKLDIHDVLEHKQTISIATYHDHRMAMSFATLSVLNSNISIEDANVVSKSYPLFWRHLNAIGIKHVAF
jgi:3-phosphoshikimate 1-carboxyvinyltransferase